MLMPGTRNKGILPNGLQASRLFTEVTQILELRTSAAVRLELLDFLMTVVQREDFPGEGVHLEMDVGQLELRQ